MSADTKTMKLQYLEALRSLGMSPSSKVIVPMELSEPRLGLHGRGGGRVGERPVAGPEVAAPASDRRSVARPFREGVRSGGRPHAPEPKPRAGV